MNGRILEIGMTILKPYEKDKLLIVGLGSIGKKYRIIAKKYFKLKNILIFSKHKKKTSISELKKKNNIKYIILSNPSTERINFFRSFIKKGATYIFEKPIASNMLEKKEQMNLYQSIKKNNIKIKSGYCLRMHPAVRELKKLVNKNLKNILRININTNSFLPSWRNKNYQKSVSAQKKYGGGVMNELSHEIDLILYLFGRPKSVFARYVNTKSLKINTEDVVDVIFSMNSKLNLNLHLDFCSPFEKREIEVILRNKKKIVLDLNKNSIFFSNLKKTISKKYKIIKNFCVNSQIKEMIRISKSRNKNYWMSELKDAIYVLNIINKMRLSHANKKLIKLN